MELTKVIQLLKDLPEDAGILYEENWENTDTNDTWRADAMEALNVAVQILEEGSVVGTLELNGKTYKITE